MTAEGRAAHVEQPGEQKRRKLGMRSSYRRRDHRQRECECVPQGYLGCSPPWAHRTLTRTSGHCNGTPAAGHQGMCSFGRPQACFRSSINPFTSTPASPCLGQMRKMALEE